MKNENKSRFIKDSSSYITNINRALKSIKSEIVADFIRMENSGIIITTNKVVAPLDLQTIKQYVKNINSIESDKVEVPRLPQFKSYLKILDIQYLGKNSNMPISANAVKKIIKNNHIFNNIVITSKPRVIKVFSKLDIAII